MKVSIATALLLASTSSFGQTPANVFGLNFGSRLPFPECKFQVPLYGSKEPPQYEMFAAQTCVRLGKDSHIEALQFTRRDKPALIREEVVEVVDEPETGLAFIRYATFGYLDQDKQLEALTAKFGKPQTQEVTQAQTLGGAKVDSIYATWSSSGVTVVLLGTGARIDRGIVSFSTAAGAEAAKRRAAARAGPDPRPL